MVVVTCKQFNGYKWLKYVRESIVIVNYYYYLLWVCFGSASPAFDLNKYVPL